ncbi:hypothetical protein BGZ65_006592, partial [Modicella reniformis]
MTDGNVAMEMEIDDTQGQRKNKDDKRPTTTPRSKGRNELGSVQRQTLYNQGSVMASDLSIVGFIKLDAVQSPPILSRHWITIDHPQQHDAIANPGVKEEVMREREDEGASTESKALKTEDSLAATLFPDIHIPPAQPPYHDGTMAGTSQDLHNSPSTVAASQPSPKFVRGKKNEAESTSWGQNDLPRQHLYSTLHQAMDQESMVAIVALQYPDKTCTRLRKWRRAQDDAPLKAQKAPSTSTTAAGLPKRLYSQGSSPGLPIHNASDLHAQGGGVGALSSSSTLGSLTGSTLMNLTSTSSSLTGSGVPKEDVGSAITSASLSTLIDDRRWCGLLMVASHFLSCQFHSTPVHLSDTHVTPKNATTTNAPWIPNMNYDKPYFYTKPVRETQFIFLQAATMTRHNTLTEIREPSEFLTCTGMEYFRAIKATLQDIRSDLQALKAKHDHPEGSRIWDKQLENRIRRNVASLRSIEAIYGSKNGIKNAMKMLKLTLRSLGVGSEVHRRLSALIQNLLNADHVEGFVGALVEEDSNRDYHSKHEGTQLKEQPVVSVGPKLTKSIKGESEFKTKIEPKEYDEKRHHDNLEAGYHTENTALVRRQVPVANDRKEVEDEDEEVEEDMGGGSVVIRGSITLGTSKSLDETEARDKSMEKLDAGVMITSENTISRFQQNSESEAKTFEQGVTTTTTTTTTQEASSALYGHSLTRHLAPKSSTGPTITEYHQQKRSAHEEQDESRLMSPGLAPQKRRRELLDDASDDASSVEGIPISSTTIVKTSEGDGEAALLTGTSYLHGPAEETGHVGTPPAQKKGAKKTKRIKAEPLGETTLQRPPQEPVYLHTHMAEGRQEPEANAQEMTFAASTGTSLEPQPKQQQFHQLQQPPQGSEHHQVKGKG